MRATARLALQLGLVPQQFRQELRNWGHDIPEVEPLIPNDQKALQAAFEDALLEDGFALIQVTDLNVIREFLSKAQKGMLSIRGEPAFEVSYLERETTGDFVFPWASGMTDITEEMCDRSTVLTRADGSTVTFVRTYDLYTGTTRLFLVACTRA